MYSKIDKVKGEAISFNAIISDIFFSQNMLLVYQLIIIIIATSKVNKSNKT
jgi:hypothetical protein